uniref:fructose-bisphosphate aldolase n=1 Tax=Cucumis sativus TaxID=3659 RepID=A0A0A0LCC5_CUCSA
MQNFLSFYLEDKVKKKLHLTSMPFNKLESLRSWTLSFSFWGVLLQSTLKLWSGKRCKANSDATLGKNGGGSGNGVASNGLEEFV